MRFSVKILLSLFVLMCAAPRLLPAQDTIPRFVTIEPMNGKTGDVAVVTGENVGKTLVAELYLTDGKNDFKCVMAEQADTTIKFTIPKGPKPGVSYKLMVLTKGKEPKLIEQPVRFTIDE
jgi:hypothetical protein